MGYRQSIGGYAVYPARSRLSPAKPKLASSTANLCKNPNHKEIEPFPARLTPAARAVKAAGVNLVLEGNTFMEW